jgi:hypothetical protein
MLHCVFSFLYSNCDTVILPRVGDDIKGKEQEFCPRCECKYESRNTTIIKVCILSKCSLLVGPQVADGGGRLWVWRIAMTI